MKTALSNYFHNIKESGRDIKIIMYSTLLIMVVLCLDIINKPSAFYNNIPKEMRITLIIGACILLFIYAIYKRTFQIYKNVSPCFIDSLSFICFITSSFSIIIWSLTDGLSYKTIIGIIIMICSSTSIVARLVIVYEAYKKFNKVASNNVLYDLKSIYDNKFSAEKNAPIRISEKDVDYDLLGRKSVIDQLYMFVSNYKADTSYVIGLIGAWGSGKTTIINNVKKMLKEKQKAEENKHLVFIDDFDPWIYGTQEALLTEMFDKIMKKTGVEFSLSHNRDFINSLKTITTKSVTDLKGIDKIVDKITNSDSNDLSFLMHEISKYLTLNDKTVVFFIDNIDRAEADNIILMFKLISTVFNLPNIVYVLSYDKTRVNDILNDTKKINPKYTEKIINHEIYLSPIHFERLNDIYQKSVDNILSHYGVVQSEKSSYLPVIEYICKINVDLRNFKRYINSVFTNVFLNPCKLDRTVMLIIETIRFFDNELYELVLNHAAYFISEDYIYNVDLGMMHQNKALFEKNAKEWFDEVFKNRLPSRKLLSFVFPYVYLNEKNIENIDERSANTSKLIKQDAPIYSLKFFELYFTYYTNVFLEDRTGINKLVYELNCAKTDQEVQFILDNVLYSASKETHKEKIEVLQSKLDDISEESIVFTVISLWKNLNSIDDTQQFLNLSALERTILIISMLLVRINEKELNKIISLIKTDYSRIIYINHLVYWLNSSKLNNPQLLKDKFETLYSGICHKVIEEKIDLYSDGYYRQYNITGGLFQFYDKNENKNEILKTYIKSVFKEKYVYRLIADLIINGVGSDGYSYALTDNSTDILYVGEETIDKSLKNNPPKNESEKRIKEIYEKFKNREVNSHDKYGIVLPEPFIFDL